jgi:hypothetical protein
MGHTQSCGAGGSFGFAGFGVCPHKNAGAQQANRHVRREIPRCTEGNIPAFHGNAELREVNADGGAHTLYVLLAFLVFLRSFEMLQHERNLH